MIGYGLVMLVLPLLAGLGEPAPVDPAQAEVNVAVGAAAQAARAYEPAWMAGAREALGSMNGYSVEVIDAVHSAAEETGVAPELIWAVAYTETKGFHTTPDGTVKRGSSGEIGVMQVKPFWSKALKKKYGVNLDLYSVKDNIMAGALILKSGGDDTRVALSYYNTGQRLKSSAYERKVTKYLAALETPRKSR
jgi:soluble lytic murein transglycosylase-like protein